MSIVSLSTSTTLPPPAHDVLTVEKVEESKMTEPVKETGNLNLNKQEVVASLVFEGVTQVSLT